MRVAGGLEGARDPDRMFARGCDDLLRPFLGLDPGSATPRVVHDAHHTLTVLHHLALHHHRPLVLLHSTVSVTSKLPTRPLHPHPFLALPSSVSSSS